FFFFQAEDGIRDPLVTGVQTCALPIWLAAIRRRNHPRAGGLASPAQPDQHPFFCRDPLFHRAVLRRVLSALLDRVLDHAATSCKDRKSTRLNSSHEWISYAVFCLKKKK